MAVPAPTVAATTATQTLTTITPEIHKVTPVSGWTNILGVEVNPSVAIFTLVVITIVYALYRAQKSGYANNFNAWDLVMDLKPDGTRVTSGIKFAYQCAFVLSSWVVIDNQIKGTLTEGIFGLYLSVWCASLIAKVVWDKPIDVTGIIRKTASDPHQ